jgi:hypothetical protein
MNERDRQNKLLQNLQSDKHDLELKKRDLSANVREKQAKEADIAKWKRDIDTYNENMKVICRTVSSPLSVLTTAYTTGYRCAPG